MNKRAVLGRKSWFSPVWLIPLVAAAVGFWMIFESASSRGPEISVQMSTAEGIEAGKTLVKIHDVEIGRVESVQLTDDYKNAIVKIQMNADAEPLLKADTEFWVVKPRIARDGVSGLTTLLSGAYIRLQPGNSDESSDDFVALDKPPVSPADAAGLHVRLSSSVASELNVGDQISYRGFPVGQVEEANFDPQTRQASYRLFVRAPYDVLVTENTRFWLESGVRVQVGSGGLKLDLGSLESILAGGITFDVPNDQPRGEMAEEDSLFKLFGDEEQAIQEGYTRAIEYVLMIDGTVRGLNEGAAVEYRGVRVGTVANAPYRFYPDDDNDVLPLRLIPIKIRFEPDRLEGLVSQTDLDGWRERMRSYFSEGLRGTLKSGNLLTNSMYVDLAFYPDEPIVTELTSLDGIPVMPTVAGGLAQLEQKLSRLLDNFNSIPMEKLATTVDQTLTASTKSLASFEQTSDRLSELLATDGAQELPGSLQQTLEQLNSTLKGFDSDSPAFQQLDDSVEQLNELLRELQPLAETLNEQPNSLIFGRDQVADPEPKARN